MCAYKHSLSLSLSDRKESETMNLWISNQMRCFLIRFHNHSFEWMWIPVLTKLLNYAIIFSNLCISFPFWFYSLASDALQQGQANISGFSPFFCCILIPFRFCFFVRFVIERLNWRFGLVWKENRDGYFEYYTWFEWFWNWNVNWACHRLLHVYLLPANWCQGRFSSLSHSPILVLHGYI